MNSSYFSSGRKDMICTAVGDIAAGDAILAASKGSLSKTLASRKEVDVTEWDEKIAFPTDGWETALAKSPLLTCAEMDRSRHIANSVKKHQNSEYHSVAYRTSKSQGFSG